MSTFLRRSRMTSALLLTVSTMTWTHVRAQAPDADATKPRIVQSSAPARDKPVADDTKSSPKDTPPESWWCRFFVCGTSKPFIDTKGINFAVPAGVAKSIEPQPIDVGVSTPERALAYRQLHETWQISIGIGDFDSTADTSSIPATEAGRIARGCLLEEFSLRRSISDPFKIVDPGGRKVRKSMLGVAGFVGFWPVTPQKAMAYLPELSAVQFVVAGSVDRVEYTPTSNSSRISGNVDSMSSRVSIRVLDQKTGEIVSALSAEGESSSKSNCAALAAEFPKPAAEAIANAVKAIVIELEAKRTIADLALRRRESASVGAVAAAAPRPLSPRLPDPEPQIVAIDDARAFVWMGSTSGVAVGDHLVILRESAVQNPSVAASATRRVIVGSATVDAVQDNILVIELKAPARVGDFVRRE